MKKMLVLYAVLILALTGIGLAQNAVALDNVDAAFAGDTSFVFFDGMAFPSAWITWSWGQSTFTVEEGSGATEGTNAIKWVQGDEWGNGWSGIGITFDVPYDMSAVWESDTLTFKMKADPGTGLIRLQFMDGVADPRDRTGKVFDPIADGTWHDFAFPLKELEYQDNSTTFDSSMVWILEFMAEASAIAGQVISIDDIWTGQPEFDEVPPAAPENFFVAEGDYSNLIVWDDVPAEEGEVYTIYYCKDPITSLEDDGLEIVSRNVPENTESVAHLLVAPVTDQEVSYYYAIVCKDAAYNVSDVTATPDATTNTARGIVTISLDPPVSLVCDGDLGEWEGIDPIRIYPSLGAVSVPNYPVDDDNDLSIDAYLAVDAEFLYMACDVTDDLVEHDTSANPWENDRIDVFIGLYDQRGLQHTSYERGEEPDYHFNFEFDELIFEVPDSGSPYTPDSAWYHIGEKFPSGYIIETRLPWALIAGTEDVEFNPREGMRIPIDFSIQDRDGGIREGILTWSPKNQDQSWQSPQYWTYTWIGSLWEPVKEARGDVNGDGVVDIIDIIVAVNHFLGTADPPLTGAEIDRADCNADGVVDILDIVGIVNVLLGTGTCPPGGAKTQLTSDVLEVLALLQAYLAPADFARLMEMVKLIGIPTEYSLAQNYPNPFNPVTSIEYTVPRNAKVKLSVFNVLGQEVKVLVDGWKEVGYHKVQWDAHPMASGVYFYRLETEDFVSTKRCLLVK